MRSRGGLGIEVLEAAVGRSVLRMTVRDEMVNGFGTSHGGIVFSLADSAFAFAINRRRNAQGGDRLHGQLSRGRASGRRAHRRRPIEDSTTNRLAFCVVTVRNQHDAIVGHFRGTGYRTARPHSSRIDRQLT